MDLVGIINTFSKSDLLLVSSLISNIFHKSRAMAARRQWKLIKKYKSRLNTTMLANLCRHTKGIVSTWQPRDDARLFQARHGSVNSQLENSKVLSAGVDGSCPYTAPWLVHSEQKLIKPWMRDDSRLIPKIWRAIILHRFCFTFLLENLLKHFDSIFYINTYEVRMN